MRFKIELNALDKKIPIGNRFMICSLIKRAISDGDTELFNSIYKYEDKKNKKIKDFTFSIYLNDFKVSQSYIDVNGKIIVTISTSNYNVWIAIYNGLLGNKSFTYKDYKLEVVKVTLLKENKVTTNSIVCKTLSPIFIKDKEGKAIDIYDDSFEETLNYISDIYLKTFRGMGLTERIKFSPIDMKKVVIKEEIAGFQEVTGKKFIFIDAYKGVFNLQGNIHDLQILLEAGLGFRRSEGFGLIDLI